MQTQVNLTPFTQMQVSMDGQESSHNHIQQSLMVSLLLLIIQLHLSVDFGLFKGSQLNWAALTKEAYAIYMSVKKLSFYLIQADVLLKSDHLPLKRFLHKNTLNSKVNNCAMELESFNIQFEHFKGQNNVLADILSHLIDIHPETQLTLEGDGYEFSYAVFEELPDIHTFEINEVIAGFKEIKNDPDLHDALQCIDNPIVPE